MILIQLYEWVVNLLVFSLSILSLSVSIFVLFLLIYAITDTFRRKDNA